jgi:hypothetical protein
MLRRLRIAKNIGKRGEEWNVGIIMPSTVENAKIDNAAAQRKLETANEK